MDPNIGQLLSMSFEAIVNEKKKPANQFAENALLNFLEKKGAIKRIDFGPTIEMTLDYQRNPAAQVLSSDLQGISLNQTEILDAATYSPAAMSVPITWSKADEAKNQGKTKKVEFVKALMENTLTSHDDLLEESLFAASTNGLLGFDTLLASGGQGTVGNINSANETWWRHTSGTFLTAGTDIETQLTTAWNAAAKGTGGRAPNLLFSGPTPHGTYEGSLQSNQRYKSKDTGNAGFTSLQFKNEDYIFSQHGSTLDERIWGINTKCFQLLTSKTHFRRKGEVIEIPQAEGYTMHMFSMLQLVTNNKSRGFVVVQD